MATDLSRVIVATDTTAHATSVHHRDFPEIRAGGEDAKIAAIHLANQLTRALDSALTQWRRDTIGRVIADAQAFIAQGKVDAQIIARDPEGDLHHGHHAEAAPRVEDTSHCIRQHRSRSRRTGRFEGPDRRDRDRPEHLDGHAE